MLELSVSVILAVFLLCLSVLFYFQMSSAKPSKIPGVDPSHPTDGNWADIKRAGSLQEYLADLHRQYGAIASFWMGEQKVISIASPQLFKEHRKAFDRPAEFFAMLEPLITKRSLQTTNGAEARRRRQMYDSVYSHAAITNYFEIFTENTRKLLDELTAGPPGEHVPLYSTIRTFAIRAVSKTTLGGGISEENITKLLRSFTACWIELEAQMVGDIPGNDSQRMIQFYEERDAIHEIFREAVMEQRHHIAKHGTQQLIDVMIENDVDEEVIFADILLFIVAGFHTATSLFFWTFYHLHHNPDVERKVLNEITQVVGDDGEITPEHVSQLKYMRQVIDEVIRCSILATWLIRRQEMDIQLGGYTVPAKTSVIQAIGVVMHDPAIWPEPHRFDPDRHCEQNVSSRPKYSFEPFGFAGGRKCPGFRFVYAEATILFAMLLPKLRVQLVEGQNIVPVYSISNRPQEEAWVTVEKRT